MKKILLTGKADKRIIAYPMMYLANNAGKTLLVTDDPNYRRLYEGYDTEGDLDNIHIEIHPLFKDDADFSAIIRQAEENSYDVVLFILDAHREDKIFDRTIIFAHQYMTFLGADIDEVIEDTPNVTVIAAGLGKMPTPQKIKQFNWTVEDFTYMTMVEEQRKLFPPKDKKLIELMKKDMIDSLPALTSAAYDGLVAKGGRH